MKLLFILFFSGCSLMACSQRKYNCEYKEMRLFPMPDSMLPSLREQIEKQGIPAEVAEQIAGQLNLPGLLTSCWRKVNAGPDSTFILITRNDEDDGNVKLSIPDTKLLFRKGEIYLYNPGKKRFLTDTVVPVRRTFEKSPESKIILDHHCTVYASTDSFCRIWVAEDLPGYINPGIRTGNIKGAVMAYDLKQKGQSIHAEMVKIDGYRYRR